MSVTGQCLGTGLPGYGNHTADSWGQALGSILGALEAGKAQGALAVK